MAVKVTKRFSGPGVRGEARTAPELQYKDKVIVWHFSVTVTVDAEEEGIKASMLLHRCLAGPFMHTPKRTSRQAAAGIL